MVKQLQTITFLLVLFGLSQTVFGQDNVSKHKFSLNLYKGTISNHTLLNGITGVEVEYRHTINPWIGYAVALESAHYNGIPRNPNSYKNAEGLSNFYGVPTTDEPTTLSNQTVNQHIFSAQLYVTPIHTQHHEVYVSTGVGYGIEDITHQYVSNTYVKDGNEYKKVNILQYTASNSRPILGTLSLGYDYKLNKGWTVGANLRGQIALKNDKYFSTPKMNGGSVFGEMFRLGIKVGKSF